MILNQQNCLNPQTFPRDIPLEELSVLLRTHGCNGCNLGSQKKLIGPVFHRGSSTAKIMIIGEGAGRIEDRDGKTFVGPAGEKGDTIFTYAGLDPNLDMYWCNVTKCRPIAPAGSGKENLPPTSEQVKCCLPYLKHQINIVCPKIIITAGMVAFKGLFPVRAHAMGDILLHIVNKPFVSTELNATILPMYHPAVLLYSQKDEKKLQFYRFAIRDQVATLKQLIKEKIDV